MLIVRCPDCRSEYEVASPEDVTALSKVRCPKCKAVFAVPPETPAEKKPSVPAGDGRRSRAKNRSRRSPITDPALARRMARAMIAEIVLSRETDREEGRQTGTLLSRFGPAIVAAYGIYGRKVSPELPAFRSIFRDAVNDVLGQGQTLI